MIHLAKEKFPVAKLVMSAILPRHDYTDLNDLGQVFNMHVSILCKKLNVRFVNFSDHFESNSLFAFDGLHLNYEGCAKFAQTITDDVTSLLVRTIPGSAPHVAKPRCPKELTILVRPRPKPKKTGRPSKKPSPQVVETQPPRWKPCKASMRIIATDSDGFQRVGSNKGSIPVHQHLPRVQPLCLLTSKPNPSSIPQPSSIRPPTPASPYIQAKKSRERRMRKMAKSRKKRNKRNRRAVWDITPYIIMYRQCADLQPEQQQQVTMPSQG
ncbi:uncharacterized protein [Asterias amurensis]|uniref:uncharacterized protein n=1 Tax=Asterias amurensis TaxID=7602 RepID=UPI003AB2DFD4